MIRAAFPSPSTHEQSDNLDMFTNCASHSGSVNNFLCEISRAWLVTNIGSQSVPVPALCGVLYAGRGWQKFARNKYWMSSMQSDLYPAINTTSCHGMSERTE